MTPNPMALDAKALEAAERLTREQTFSALTIDEHRLLIRDAIRAYLAALPPPAAGEGLTPVKLHRLRTKLPNNNGWTPWSEWRMGPSNFSETFVIDGGVEAEDRVFYTSTPAARAAVLEEAASAVEAFILPESGPDYGMMSDATRYVTRKTNGIYQQLAHEIRALKEKT